MILRLNKQPTNLILIVDHYKISEFAFSFASSFASHAHELHKKISDKIARNNANYELRADVRKRLKTFNVGDVVKKLHVSSVDPFQILNKLNNNAYVIGISSTFNIKDLVDYKDLDFLLLIVTLLLSLFLRVLSFFHSKIFYLTQQIKLIKS